ncbi:MAG: O-acetyl-ADP-ribose deacetylase [Candidatus Latescibacteria bacterium]|nr:O-acetyl-ADP-ribose deacetylase [Candidatus Latescibacterota bacterium]
MNGRVTVKIGDITKENVDAIVNAANSGLMGGGGVDGAIHRAGGPKILEECKRLRQEQYPEGLNTGRAVSTTAGKLPAKYVIHTVGPVWQGGKFNEEKLLANCYRNSLHVANEKGCISIAFPAISTGVFRFPKELAASVASKSVKEFLKRYDSIKSIIFVFFSSADENIFISKNEFDK